MNFARYFVDRPIFAGVLSILITLIGALAGAWLATQVPFRPFRLVLPVLLTLVWIYTLWRKDLGREHLPLWSARQEALLAPREARFVPFEHPAFHPGRCAQVVLDGQPVGVIGELHPKWRQAYDLPQAPVLFELDVPALAARQVPRFTSVPKMQSVHRDLALVVADQTSFEALMAAIHEAPTEGLVRDARLFDIYKPKTPVAGIGDNERSLAVRVSLRDDEQTLNDERIDAAMKAVLNSLSERVGARVRA